MNWNRLQMKFVIFFSIYLGATLLRIDIERRQLRPTNLFLKIYATLGGLIFLLWIPYTVVYTADQAQHYATNPVAKYANLLTLVTRLLLIFVFVLSRPQRDRKLGQWLESILDIQKSYFDRFRDIPKHTGHRKWLYLNSGLTYFHITSVAVDIYRCVFEGQYRQAIKLYPLLGMLGVQHLIMLQHAILLGYLRERLSQINYQLMAHHQDPKLALIFSQLRQKLLQLNNIYNPSILCTLLCLIISNSMVGYAIFMLFLVPEQNSHRYDYLFGDSFYFCILVHMYLYFMICEWVMNSLKETQAILYESNRPLNKEEEEELEKVTLSCCLNNPNINIFGMAPINLSSLFSITAQTVLYITILIQTEMENYRIKSKIN